MHYMTLPDDFKAAFKDADIRGRYPHEINEVLAYRVGCALVLLLEAKEVIVARDMRSSSPAVMQALCEGARDSGGHVLDLGLMPTTVLYRASGDWDAWGVMVTASHNPADQNGLKIVRPGAVPLTKATGLQKIQRYVEQFSIEKQIKVRRGNKTKRTCLRSYVRTIEREVPLTASKPLKIVADAGNGMASVMLSALHKNPAYTIDVLNETLDGTFPVRASNPMLRKNQRPIRQALQRGSYDLGVSFDGDGDRIAFFLPNGTMLNGAVAGAMIAEQIIATHPKATCVDTVFNSRIYRETVRAAGGVIKKARVGHAFIKNQMRKHDAVFACEHSGHYYFRANYYADSSLLALRYMMQAILNTGGDMTAAVRPYQMYYQTEEILVEVPDKKAILKKLQEKYSKQTDSTVRVFDGVNVELSDVWFTVKPSVTEDALKFVVESHQKKRAVAVQKELQQFLLQ